MFEIMFFKKKKKKEKGQLIWTYLGLAELYPSRCGGAFFTNFNRAGAMDATVMEYSFCACVLRTNWWNGANNGQYRLLMQFLPHRPQFGPPQKHQLCPERPRCALSRTKTSRFKRSLNLSTISEQDSQGCRFVFFD